MRFDLTPEQEARALAAVMEVLDTALPAHEMAQASLLEARDEEFIRKEVERKLYTPVLPNGSFREQRWVERCRKLSRNNDLVVRVKMEAMRAAKKWQEMDGWYYHRSPLTPKGTREAFQFHSKMHAEARDAKDWDLVWFHRMMLDGLPERVADFRMECLFLLRRSDGNTDRIVRLRNVVGERTKPIPLPAEEYRSPEKFRGWCLNAGNYHWGGNQKQIEALHLDIGRTSAHRIVNEVSSCGWLPLAANKEPGSLRLEGLWFFGDAVYAPGGERLEPDDHGVYWWKGEGYRLSDSGRENPFAQKQPRMYPAHDIRSMKLELAFEHDRTEAGIRRAFFADLCDRLRRTMGSQDAHLVIGGMLAFAAAPELFEELSLFPGMWVHGVAGSGKSTICEWLMEIWGFHLPSGLILRGKNTSAVGLLQALDQYSNLPVWGDEFRFAEVLEDKLGVLHQAYNRGGQLKFNPSGQQRVIRTNFLVSGESTTDDAALRGRYLHIQISAEKREKDADGKDVNHAAWFNAHREFFFVFGRFIMERREEFSKLVLGILKNWRETSPGVNERIKVVYGIPYACFVAMGNMLETLDAEDMKALKAHTAASAADATVDVVSELNINVFWTDLITAFKADAIPVECFKIRSTNLAHPPGAPNQFAWTGHRLYMDVDATLNALQIHLAKGRSALTLKRKDLRDQLSKMPYWVEGPHTERFGTGGEKTKCWCFDMERFPELGYRRCTDEEYTAYMEEQSTGDPRKGELYVIVHAVDRKNKAVT